MLFCCLIKAAVQHLVQSAANKNVVMKEEREIFLDIFLRFVFFNKLIDIYYCTVHNKIVMEYLIVQDPCRLQKSLNMWMAERKADRGKIEATL